MAGEKRKHARPCETLMERFLKKTEKTDGCWLWKDIVGSHGYGSLSFRMGRLLAHRVSYELFNGDIPKGYFVLHKCDNRKCVNPAHLFTGTQKDNVEDMESKGRDKKFSKLTDAQVDEIRNSIDERDSDLAVKYNVSRPMITSIRRYQRRIKGIDLSRIQIKKPSSGHAGITNSSAKLNENQVKEIKKKLLSNRKAAKFYNVSRTTIERIRSGEIWKHLNT